MQIVFCLNGGVDYKVGGGGGGKECGEDCVFNASTCITNIISIFTYKGRGGNTIMIAKKSSGNISTRLFTTFDSSFLFD